IGSTSVEAATTITSWGYPVEAAHMDELAKSVGETTLLNRTGGAPSLAVGMAQIFASTLGGDELLSIWYHFAIMFEALFILTVLDAGTRVGRFMVQELLGHVYKPLGATGSYGSIIFASFLTCGAWGYFLWQGVIDPLGGINSLWPLFGISNQLLASCALVVATTILLKMGKKQYAWVTVLPMIWLIIVTMTASYQKIFDDSPKLGFLANAHAIEAQIASGAIAGDAMVRAQHLIFNNYLNVGVTALLVALILVLIFEALTVWLRILGGSRDFVLNESPYVATKWPLEGRV
ncbi:MAG: carbon starvation CstA 5TM domain-containing protein, partial [Vicinamibacteria bacterium]